MRFASNFGSALRVGVLALPACAGCGHPSAPAPRPPQVEVANVVQQDVRLSSEWIATLDGYVNAQIQPQVTGYLIQQTYHEGSFVQKNDVLFEIDPRPFQAALDQARAQLAQAQAQLGNAQLNVKRDIPEAKAGAIAQSQLDGDAQAELAARAAVDAGRAAAEQAELNLSFTKVRSLIGGIAGIAQVQVGNLVNPTTVLTAVSQLDPIKAYFPINAEDYLRIADAIKSDAVNLLSTRTPIALQLILSNGPYAHDGSILFADRQVDQQTGTIRIVGAFANPGNVLRPGQYGKVRAVTQIRKNALLVPQRAVTELQGSYQVAVVGAGDKIAIRTVQAGERVDSMWIITSGLKLGERVVAEGVQKVKDGATVAPVPFAGAAGSR
jgi:RND family efflux transporter MFP subunit